MAYLSLLHQLPFLFTPVGTATHLPVTYTRLYLKTWGQNISSLTACFRTWHSILNTQRNVYNLIIEWMYNLIQPQSLCGFVTCEAWRLSGFLLLLHHFHVLLGPLGKEEGRVAHGNDVDLMSQSPYVSGTLPAISRTVSHLIFARLSLKLSLSFPSFVDKETKVKHAQFYDLNSDDTNGPPVMEGESS